MNKKNKIFLVLLSYNTLFYISGATFSPYIGVYFKQYGMSISQIGLLSSVGPLVALVMQPLWGIVADKKKKHILVLQVALIGSIMGILMYYHAKVFWLFALCTASYTCFNCAVNPIGDAIVVDEALKHGFQFSTIRMGGTIGYAIAVICSGIYLKKNPIASFGITAVVLIAMITVTFFLPKDVNALKTERKKVRISAILKQKKIVFILFYACVFQIVLGFYGAFLGIIVTDMGYDNSTIGILMCISALSEIPVLLCINKLMKKIKVESLLLMAGIMMSIRMWLPLAGSLSGIIVGQALQGVTYMVMYYSCVMFMNVNLEEELHGTGQALLCMVQTGIACLFSNVVGGYLGGTIGLFNTYFIYGVVLFFITISCGVFIKWYRHKR